jgi:sugar phosphate isomerase/epimerase
MKIGVSSYSFARLPKERAIPQLDLCEKAKAMGFEVIEFSGLAVPEGHSAESVARQVRERAEAAGIPIANYTIGADLLNGSGGDWQAEVERLKGEVRVAAVLGVTGMRHDATRGFAAEHTGPRGFEDALPTLAKGCRAVTEFAADHGIRTMVENHGFFCQDSERVERLANAVGHPNFGILIDIGNFLCADEDPVQAVGRLAPYTVHAHAKDFHTKPGTAPDPGRGWFRSRAGNYLRGSIIGHGDVAVGQCIGILKRAGYDGVLSIEFEGMEDPLNAIEVGRENLVRYVAE